MPGSTPPSTAREQADLALDVEEVRRRVITALPDEGYVQLVRLLERLVDVLDPGPAGPAGALPGQRPWSVSRQHGSSTRMV